MTEEQEKALVRIVRLTADGDDRTIADKFLENGGSRLEIESFITRAEVNILPC